MTQDTGGLTHVLALSGHDGCGKTTTAHALAALTGGVVISLADALKEAAARHLGIPLDVVRAKPTPEHLRAYMRALGWSMRAEHGAGYWLGEWHARVAQSGAPVVIVDDVRHLNEAEYVTARGAALISLTRDGTDPAWHADLPPIVQEVFKVRRRVQAGYYDGARTGTLDLSGFTPDEAAAHLAASFGFPPRRASLCRE